MIKVTYRSIFYMILLLGIFMMVTISNIYAIERIRWKMQHTGLPGQVKPIEEFAETLKIMSEGKINLRLYKSNSLVPNNEIWNAIESKQLDSGMSSALYILDKNPELSVFSAIPFGPSITEFKAWMNFGGGQELKNEIYSKRGIKALGCGFTATESGGWFKNHYKSVGELKGINMRIYGLGAKVMQKIGVKTQVVSFKEIKNAFKKGKIDAAEFGYPAIDYLIGMHNVAKYNYYPGWQQQFAVVDFIVQKDKWDGLSKAARKIFEVTCDHNQLLSHIRSNNLQPEAMRKLEKEGVNFMTWKDSDLRKFEKAWDKVAEEISAENPIFKKVYSKYSEFRKQYAVWGDKAYLK